MSHTPSNSGADHLRAALETPELEDLRRKVQAVLPGYQLLTCLGRGGVGAVFRAHDMRLDREVAVKVLLPAPDEVQGWHERFLREAKALARLNHPGIVRVFDYGQSDELAWIVLEFVDGANLRQVMSEGGLKPAEALAIVPQICDALQYAHDQGVVHRDVKPENVLLDERGNVRIADFGLAKLTDAGATWQLTGSAQAMGTLRYMAPEQLERPKEVDHRADIFSLGVVFYEMLTGQVPAGAVQPPSSKAGGDPRLDDVVMKSMEREPEERFQRVDDLSRELEDLEDAPAPQPVRATPSESSNEEFRYRLRIMTAIALFFAVLTVFGTWDRQTWGDTVTETSGFEEPMGQLLLAQLVGMVMILGGLWNHRRGMTVGTLFLVLSPLLGWWALVYQMQSYSARETAWPMAMVGISGVLTLLGLIQVLLRDEGTPMDSLRAAKDQLFGWKVWRLDLWPYIGATVPFAALLMFILIAFSEPEDFFAKTTDHIIEAAFLVMFAVPFISRRSPSDRRAGTALQLVMGLVVMGTAHLWMTRGNHEEVFAAGLGLATSAVCALRLLFSTEWKKAA